MERLGVVARQHQQGQQGGSMSLLMASGPVLAPSSVDLLVTLMEQTAARFVNQQLPPGTSQMYLVEWAELAVAFGLKEFRDALSKVIRESRFFPDPLTIREVCERDRQAALSARKGRQALKELEIAKAIWLRERDEDIANGMAREPLPVEVSRASKPVDPLEVARQKPSVSKPVNALPLEKQKRKMIAGWTPEELEAEAAMLRDLQQADADRSTAA